MTTILRGRATAVAVLGVLALVTSLCLNSSASAAPPKYFYIGAAGGTQVNAVGLTVKSDPTAQSAVVGSGAKRDTAKVASVNVSGLLHVGAVTTDSTATPEGDGAKVVAHAKTAGVSLLGGAITIDAIETTTTVEENSSIAPRADSDTTLLGLKISGKSYPANVAKNTGIVIPGVASVVLNAATSGVTDSAAAITGGGIVVTLLKARNGAAAGAEIIVNPTFASIQLLTAPDSGAPVGGTAYGTYVEAHVGDKDQVEVESGKSAMVNMPALGTNDKTISNSTASVHLPGVLNVGAVESAANGISTPSLSEVTESTKIARVYLFNGLITASALGSTSHAKYVDGGGSANGSLQFINLRIAGKAIPIDVAPNTSIHVANLGTVTINEQKKVASPGIVHGYEVIGLHIVLDTARAGLPVGAEVQVATSQAVVWD